jgi:hypothetical protein
MSECFNWGYDLVKVGRIWARHKRMINELKQYENIII